MAKTKTGGDYPLGDRIKYLRELRGLTQAALAEKCGISQGALAQFESGMHAPLVSTLVKLAEKLDLEPALFFRTDKVLIFDLEKLGSRYKKIGQLPDGLYRDLSTIYLLAKKMGFE